LEKTSKIIKSNRQPTTMSAKSCPEVPYLNIFSTPPGKVITPFSWGAYSYCLCHIAIFQKRQCVFSI